ncbi:hypothetical protein [Pseudovibrio brasiliensis]|uniref:Restriction endonuclease type IV Mrr domain-containing protein n=1 Tax=Pseudovibrio brasiliensis TaxID=1898042 RepID=A0ABX8AWL1_9HYPH|nr:hypothetical protein [Pseudovibrio brasiliensis]QUS59052.1 hypothetical protein KGB56_25905 [Pseudovibrio brasiliensis]
MTDSTNIVPDVSKYSPSRYMRERHPDLFSDTVSEVTYEVGREQLSYHLETLTNQKNETVFENFAQRLCEKFIAPNIRPQTGPVGGGDGKTDAETFPVSSEVADRWFVPDNDKAGERKAFAFSAKKTWRPKVKSDVTAIAGTKRDYDQIIFVTNQFVPAKKSADLQDALFKEHGIPVTILDRTWLLDRIFKHNSMDIAVEELGIGKGTEKQTKKLGPNDTKRTAELDALEAKIADGSQYQGQPTTLVEDARHAALLARGLEHSSADVNGRFDRALRLARDKDLKKLELTIAYEWAWTSHFWYEDHLRTSELYDDVERLALDSNDANDLERLNNLLPLIRMSVHSGAMDASKGKLKDRTTALKSALEALKTQTNRPSNALHAEAMLLMTQVSEKGVEHRDDPLKDIWISFTDIIRQADGLGTFPFTSIAEALTQIGEFIADSNEFDTLFETITDALATRSGEGDAAKKNVQRAYQKLAKGLPYDAIRWFGRAVTRLIKEEYQGDLIDALIGASFAFEEVGLPWAARNYALAAVSQELSEFKRDGSIGALRASVLSRYFETELKLGRMPQILSAHELELIVRSAQVRTDGQRRHFDKLQTAHMTQIASLLLQTPVDKLDSITKLPDALKRLALPMSRTALLYLMGNEDLLRTEGWIPEQETSEDAESLMRELHDWGVKAEYPVPDFVLGETVTFSSNVLGCRIELICANNLVSIGIGEAVLGSLEALLATSLDHRILPQVDHLQLRIAPSDAAGLSPVLTFADIEGEPIGTITHRMVIEYKTKEDVLSFPHWMRDAVLEFMLRFITPQDVETWGKALFEDESALDRTLAFSDVPTMLSNLHGDRAQLSLADWIDSADPIYEVKRTEEWPPASIPDAIKTFGNTKRGDGLAPKEIRDSAKRKHSNMRWISPINARKWDKARWNATLFMYSPPGPDTPPPMLGLVFQKRSAAREIFTSLRKRYGDDDVKDDLKITIVRGISSKNPSAYAVMVSHNPDNVTISEENTIAFVSRINRMYPNSTQNLDHFLAEYARHGRYVLFPAQWSNKSAQPEPIPNLPIGKHNLTVLNAWEIATNDMTASVLDLDDPPIIPEDQPNAPVIETLEWLKSLRNG